MNISVKIKFTRGMSSPEYATKGSAAVDLRAGLEEGEEVVIKPSEKALIPTGLAISLPESTVAIIAPRSGLGVKKGISLSNGIGIIDSDYRGEICVGLINHGKEDFVIKRGDRIAQMMFMPVYTAEFLPVETLDETERGEGGFGHTGVN